MFSVHLSIVECRVWSVSEHAKNDEWFWGTTTAATKLKQADLMITKIDDRDATQFMRE